jgi:hypothetical protein
MSGIGEFGIGTSALGSALGFVSAPIAPGVPPVLRDPSAALPPAQNLVTADAPGVGQGQQGPQWGIFDGGSAVVVGDSCLAVSFAKEYRISDYPVEQGGFQSYNKVATPYDFKLTFTKGGPAGDLQTFLNDVDAVVGSTQLYDAVAPPMTYMNANAVHYDYERRATKGVTLLTVNVFMREVRQTAVATFSNTVAPSGADPVQDGNVQAATPTTQQSNALAAFNPPTTVTNSGSFDVIPGF